jgi:hypothetical protein
MTFDFKGRARMIFALVGGILFLVAKAVFPQLPFSEEQTLLFVGLIGAYILGEGLSGKTIGDNLQTMLKSQKFQALIVGLLGTCIKAFFPNLAISDAELIGFIGTVMAFILGAGVQSGKSDTQAVVVDANPSVAQIAQPLG